MSSVFHKTVHSFFFLVQMVMFSEEIKCFFLWRLIINNYAVYQVDRSTKEYVTDKKHLSCFLCRHVSCRQCEQIHLCKDNFETSIISPCRLFFSLKTSFRDFWFFLSTNVFLDSLNNKYNTIWSINKREILLADHSLWSDRFKRLILEIVNRNVYLCLTSWDSR